MDDTGERHQPCIAPAKAAVLLPVLLSRQMSATQDVLVTLLCNKLIALSISGKVQFDNTALKVFIAIISGCSTALF